MAVGFVASIISNPTFMGFIGNFLQVMDIITSFSLINIKYSKTITSFFQKIQNAFQCPRIPIFNFVMKEQKKEVRFSTTNRGKLDYEYERKFSFDNYGLTMAFYMIFAFLDSFAEKFYFKFSRLIFFGKEFLFSYAFFEILMNILIDFRKIEFLVKEKNWSVLALCLGGMGIVLYECLEIVRRMWLLWKVEPTRVKLPLKDSALPGFKDEVISLARSQKNASFSYVSKSRGTNLSRLIRSRAKIFTFSKFQTSKNAKNKKRNHLRLNNKNQSTWKKMRNNKVKILPNTKKENKRHHQSMTVINKSNMISSKKVKISKRKNRIKKKERGTSHKSFKLNNLINSQNKDFKNFEDFKQKMIDPQNSEEMKERNIPNLYRIFNQLNTLRYIVIQMLVVGSQNLRLVQRIGLSGWQFMFSIYVVYGLVKTEYWKGFYEVFGVLIEEGCILAFLLIFVAIDNDGKHDRESFDSLGIGLLVVPLVMEFGKFFMEIVRMIRSKRNKSEE